MFECPFIDETNTFLDISPFLNRMKGLRKMLYQLLVKGCFSDSFVSTNLHSI